MVSSNVEQWNTIYSQLKAVKDSHVTGDVELALEHASHSSVSLIQSLLWGSPCFVSRAAV